MDNGKSLHSTAAE